MPALLNRLMGAVLVVFAASAARAQTSDSRELGDAVVQAYAKAALGPSSIRLRDLGILALPEKLAFVPAPASHRLLQGKNNATDGTVLGVVVPAGHFDGWYDAVTAVETGTSPPPTSPHSMPATFAPPTPRPSVVAIPPVCA